eukprot:8304756-Alexandrium_andersonii.AAC.1
MAAGSDAQAPVLPRTLLSTAVGGGAMCCVKNNWSARLNKAQSQRYPSTGFKSGRRAPTAGPRAEARPGRDPHLRAPSAPSSIKQRAWQHLHWRSGLRYPTALPRMHP